jgi:hypothetical protein
MPTRTAKTCGPDASVLASSLRKLSAGDGGKKADHRGERGISRKPLRGECRVIPVTRCEYSCAYLLPHSAHEAAGASGIRHSPRPLIEEGGTLMANLARNTRRDRETVLANDGCCLKLRLVCTQNPLVMPGLDPGIHPSSQKGSFRRRWIAGSSPAITTRRHSRRPMACYDVYGIPGQAKRSVPINIVRGALAGTAQLRLCPACGF